MATTHPALLVRYEQQSGNLRSALSNGAAAEDPETAEAIRKLVETVTVHRNSSHPGRVTVQISGRLNALLDENAYPNKVRGVWGRMVARERFRSDPHYANLRFLLRFSA
jgi:site-specific DNA recombinase